MDLAWEQQKYRTEMRTNMPREYASVTELHNVLSKISSFRLLADCGPNSSSHHFCQMLARTVVWFSQKEETGCTTLIREAGSRASDLSTRQLLISGRFTFRRASHTALTSEGHSEACFVNEHDITASLLKNW